MLDEPTNDLDLETLDLLQEMIADYPGTVLVVSHDRDFLDRVSTSVLMSEGDGHWTEYAGGYSDMMFQRGGGVEARKVASKGGSASAKNPALVATRGEQKRKLTFKDKHALESLPKLIKSLEMDIATLQAALADPKLYTRDPVDFDKKSKQLVFKETERAKAEEQWLELEIKREQLGE